MEGTTLQGAIDQISVDVIVPVSDESGTFVPAKGVPLRDAMVLVWIPDWIVASYNYVLLIDASMLGRYSFVVQYHGFSFSYDDIAAMLQPIWEEEIGHVYVFVPFFAQEPMQAGTRFPASHGLTIVLQRDAVPPACIPDPAEAFRLYRAWGMDVADVDQPPPDLPWPVDKVQISFGADTGLFAIGGREPTRTVLLDLARRFMYGRDEPQVTIANLLPERHVWFGEPVSQMAAVSHVPQPHDIVCLFLVLRGIGRESRSAWISRSDCETDRILAALDLDIGVIRGFKINVTGGAWLNGRMVYENGDVLFFNFIPDDDGPDTSDSERPTSDSDLEEPDSDGQGTHAPLDLDEGGARAGSSTAVSLNHIGASQSAESGQCARDGHGCATLVDMWNRGPLVSEAMWIGNQGDTSASNAEYLCLRPGATDMPRYAAHDTRTPSSRRAGVTTGIRLYLSGLALLQTLVPGGSVQLPLCEDVLSGGFLPGDGVRHGIDDLYAGAFSAGDDVPDKHPAEHFPVLWSLGSSASCTDMTGHEDVWQLLTLLESAKSEEFYRLCGELVWFFDALQSSDTAGLPDCRRSSTLSVHSHLGHVQCTDSSSIHLACQISQAAGSTGQPDFPNTPPGQVKLNLCSAVPSPCSLQAPVQSRLSCGVDSDMLEFLLDGHRLEQIHCGLEPLPGMHEHARLALQTVPRWNGKDVFSRAVLFTDGSFQEGYDLIAYAVAVLLRVHDQWHFAGYVAGVVDTSSPAVKVQANAHVAELCGMIHARLIHMAMGYDTQLEICYDCVSACQIMCLGSSKSCPVANIAASIEAICFLHGCQSSWTHVAGHSGHPWNEVVDFIARQHLKDAINGSAFAEDLVQSMLGEGYMHWLWMAVAAKSYPTSWPVAHSDGSFRSSHKLPERAFQPVMSPTEAQCQHVFRIRAVTYNTLSLCAAGQSECLEQHFGNDGCSILGLQECRQGSDSIEQGNFFFKIASPASKGQGGCQIWLSKFAHPGLDAEGNAIKWRTDTFVKHHSDSRCLAISGMAGNVRFGIISAHAPTAVSGRDDIQKFWQSYVRGHGSLAGDFHQDHSG